MRFRKAPALCLWLLCVIYEIIILRMCVTCKVCLDSNQFYVSLWFGTVWHLNFISDWVCMDDDYSEFQRDMAGRVEAVWYHNIGKDTWCIEEQRNISPLHIGMLTDILWHHSVAVSCLVLDPKEGLQAWSCCGERNHDIFCTLSFCILLKALINIVRI